MSPIQRVALGLNINPVTLMTERKVDFEAWLALQLQSKRKARQVETE